MFAGAPENPARGAPICAREGRFPQGVAVKTGGSFVLFLPGKGYWTGRGWSEEIARAKRWTGAGRPYSRAQAAAARLARGEGGAPLVAYVPCPEVDVPQIPDCGAPRPGR